MGNLIKKVFSTKLAKSYWISKVNQAPVNNIPCFSLEEIEWIKNKEVTTEELEYIYKAKLENSAFEFIPKEQLKQGAIVEKKDDRPESVKQAQKEFKEAIEKMFNKKIP